MNVEVEMILYEITVVCDFLGCANAENFEQDSNDIRALEDIIVNDGWFWGGEFGDHFCSKHNSKAKRERYQSVVFGGSL